MLYPLSYMGLCAQGGSRTRTALACRRILSAVRLPAFRHPGLRTRERGPTVTDDSVSSFGPRARRVPQWRINPSGALREYSGWESNPHAASRGAGA